MSEPPVPKPAASLAAPVIRPATTADEEELAGLDRETWSPVHSVQERPRPPYATFFDERHRPEDILVAELDGAIAGYIRTVPPTPLASNAHVRQIQGLAVADGARGRGIGRALLRAAADAARSGGAVRMTLRVLGHNTPARALYEAEGFVVEGVLPGEFLLGGQYVDDVVMGRALTDGR
ncbi:GNAT family N-acetyltransferase [Streptomyces agglomeratus]|uniref:GNAT family N-acetyltransferase n=1 Tax=Streptomyces agglomeratus TaxID=285458 RepID=A0A1E5PCD5_9ACTN|nr:GNAT family N-acetyltransferase [Streptomyces agglomeratus]OEJ27198.1 GNAT family N-acetyltransferase [Streptomyces agglomeratus]OEJ38749.1 GNAT family N-acetyltransferase [Streptomyces agglomeratus]OEJ46866.1 GNAT family N-acetyltransferase [Streptomyces agglomeratus]OEJ51277.1 GNAT family N-acetyltransferase [Streptomyces agglomeratus]OEJ58646.1 GNAT family N-acetyltransferase [Streptomyces agglomeratus]